MTNVIRESCTAWRLLAVCWLALTSLSQAATVRAYIQPAKARPNQMVMYVITVQDGQVESVPDLRLPLQINQSTAVSTSQQFSLSQGLQTTSIQLSWGVAASEPGEFVIPAQTLRINGEEVATNEVKLSVEASSDPSGLGSGEDANQPVLQIELGKKEIYQGEVMPVTCSLYVPRQTQLRRLGLIEIEKSDFAISRFPQQSDQTTTVIDGVGYVVLTFRSTLSSLRTGDLKVGPASMEILVEVPMEGVRRPNMPQNFPQAFFGVPTEPRKLVVKSQQVTLKVLPLPTEGKPASFSGAVGDFSMTATANPTELTVGDPLAVELILEGTGNFDALTTPALTAPSGWKSYPAKRYNIEGQLDQNQVPTLERKIGYSQVFIPEAVHASLPPFEVSYFSATQKQYVTLRTEAIPLTMKPAAPTSETAATASTMASSPVPPPVADPSPDITDIVIKPAPTSRWLAPTSMLLIHSSTFWTLQIVPVGLVLVASVLAIIRRRRSARMAGRAGELRAAWAEFESGKNLEADFLRHAAQFIHVASAGTPVKDPDLKAIIERYENTHFTATGASPIPATEQRKITETLTRVFKQALAKVTLLAFLGVLASTSVLAQSPKNSAIAPDEVYQEALAEMENGNFARAQYLAESLTKKKPPQLSPEVFQLIGHARYRQEDLGRAVLWYERAQLFDPRNPELRQNLRHLHERLRYLSFGEKSLLAEWSLWLTPNEWVLLASVGFWLVMFSVLWRILAGHRALFGAVMVSVLGLLIAVPAASLAAFRPQGLERIQDISLVTVPDVRAYTAATVTSGTVIDLPPGSQVRVLEKRGTWTYVEIPNAPENLRGWVEGGAITPLWSWDEALVP